MTDLGISRWDVAEYLETEEDIVLYLQAIIEEDPTLLPSALGDVARARGMTDLARKTGLAREALYQSLSEEGNPRYSTLCKVLQAYGTKISLAAIDSPNEETSVA